MIKNKIKIFMKELWGIYSNFIPPKILVFFIIILSIVFMNLQCFSIDNDFWFLINTGKYILNNGFPVIEPFTIHTGLSFVAQQWLTDLIFYFIYDNFGIYGMFIFLNLCGILIIILLYKLSMLVSSNKIKISLFSTIIIYLLLCAYFITTRPQLFDIILLLIEIYLLELYVKKNNKLYLIWLPVISLLMINLHSALWLMIFVFLVPYYIEKLINKDKENYKLKPLVITSVAMLIVGLINPYGIEAIKYLFGSYGVSEINNLVGEMQSLDISNSLFVFIIIFIGLVSYYFNKGNNKIRYFLLFLGTCYLGLSHHKGLLFFFVCIILSFSYNFSSLFKEKITQRTWYKEKSMNVILIILLFVFLVQYGYSLCEVNLKDENKPYLNEIGDYLEEKANKNIKLYTNYDDGGYLEYRGYKCYIDPRAEVFLKVNNKKEDIFIEYYNLQAGKLNYEKFLNKYNFDYLVVNNYDILFRSIKEEDYEIVYEKDITRDFASKEIVKYRIYKKLHKN